MLRPLCCVYLVVCAARVGIVAETHALVSDGGWVQLHADDERQHNGAYALGRLPCCAIAC